MWCLLLNLICHATATSAHPREVEYQELTAKLQELTMQNQELAAQNMRLKKNIRLGEGSEREKKAFATSTKDSVGGYDKVGSNGECNGKARFSAGPNWQREQGIAACASKCENDGGCGGFAWWGDYGSPKPST